MNEAGLTLEPPPDVAQELANIAAAPPVFPTSSAIRDMRALAWSSIDNSESRDLDQVEYAEQLADDDIRILIGIADVDAFVPQGSAIDRFAYENTVTVYTPGGSFPMLPTQLSTGLTSLLADEDRLAIVIELLVAPDGTAKAAGVYRAVVRNHVKLIYDSVGAWLENRAPMPAAIARVAGLEAQIMLQAAATVRLRKMRRQQGALEFATVESVPTVIDGQVTGLEIKQSSRAQDIIECFMVAANTAMADFLETRGLPSLRRVVKRPARWPRIVEIAASYGAHLPAAPDAHALAEFLAQRKQAEPAHYPELSLAVVKLIGAGEYLVEAPGLEQEGHFGLAVNDYTHATAPNRRYPDLVTQRCLKAAITNAPPPYSVAELTQIAQHCNERESAARKVERRVRKSAIALLLSARVGEVFAAVVTGVKEQGTFARLLDPPADGRLVANERGLDVGQQIKVRLLATDPARGFIDFAHVSEV